MKTCKFCDGKYCLNNPLPEWEYKKSREFLTLIGKTKTINKHVSTYGLKHKVEKWAGDYICGCSLAQAAEDLGFAMKQCSYASPNWYINFSLKGLKKLNLYP